MKIEITKKLLSNYPEIGFKAFLLKDFVNTKENDEIEELKDKIQRKLRKKKISPQQQMRIDQYNNFFKKFGNVAPLDFQIKSVVNGKKLPKVNVLVDILFMIEMKHACIVSAHDLNKAKGDLLFDLSEGGEEYVMINGKDKTLQTEDVILKNDGELITSLAYGPDQETKVTESTTDCVFLFWFFKKINEEELAEIIEDFKSLLNIVKTDQSVVEEIAVK